MGQAHKKRNSSYNGWGEKWNPRCIGCREKWIQSCIWCREKWSPNWRRASHLNGSAKVVKWATSRMAKVHLAGTAKSCTPEESLRARPSCAPRWPRWAKLGCVPQRVSVCCAKVCTSTSLDMPLWVMPSGRQDCNKQLIEKKP